ncbi:diguanylate cyclase (GGDEF) domain-containing protein [Peptoclostridium litorale DSM 5388]|uniref:Diguanylate cyclase n=1 Tax=Peptoclostridium litorale DSM 5388 TaxID=1121324 RepID=A0A069RHQ8_PEPLI|nr:GGDEF domain-containing protein [Peptoclostridium litorale]KDR96333.1 diguanylate cyclase [Peptoclostridium litorale DSM 5388]SIO26533.1 diguanylate cyclase (GGDEF) domain-containing protein [Peptoclostridium litorale DSM 5388]
MISFDTRTTVLIYTLTNILLSFVVYKTWVQNRKDFEGITYWFSDYILQAIGITLSLMRGVIPDFASIVIANFFMITGAMLFLFGLGRFVEIPIRKLSNYIFLLIFFMAYYYFGIIRPLVALRIIIFSCSFIYISIQIIWLVFWKTSENFKNITKSTGIIFIMFTAVDVFRIILAFTVPSDRDYFLGPLNDTIFVILSQMLTISLTFSIILMINRRLFLEINRHSKEKESLLLKMRHLATIDGLTGIFNRMKIEETLNNEILEFQEDSNPLSVILIDIDCFKSVNDTYGHSEGDNVLKAISSILKDNIRSTDSLGRWGGEEFLIVMPKTNLQTSYNIAKRLTSIISNHKFVNVGRVTVSMGISSLCEGDSFGELLINADKALYCAKENGRNRVEVFSDYSVSNTLA